MRVFVLFHGNLAESVVAGVFSTAEKAETHRQALIAQHPGMFVKKPNAWSTPDELYVSEYEADAAGLGLSDDGLVREPQTSS